MEAVEKRVVVVLADISGYTKFMVENQMSAVHGQQCITYLIETLIREIDLPLRLQEIEGDALFLYAEDPGSDAGWQDVLQQVPTKLMRFFDAFYEGAVLGAEATPCECAICRNSDELALKIVVHAGTAVFHKIGGFNKVSGPDVILAHRLLKNSVVEKEYLLLSEAAHSTVGQHMEGPFQSVTETYDGFGDVNTFVRINNDLKEEQRNALYERPRASLVARAELYSLAAIGGLFPALIKHLRNPVFETRLPRRVGFALTMVVRAPMMVMMYLIGTPRRLLARRAERNEVLRSKTEST
ncbi:MAG: DUF2652 domain-containing protein [Betaproteobacteria bacterium]|nr:MAG: DUF2652 domain-containing protein [Betaproteobacteria bacterium]